MFDPSDTALLMTLGMVILLGLGIPVAISMGLAGLVGLIMIGGPNFCTGSCRRCPTASRQITHSQ